MENHTIVQLKVTVRERGKLKKAELINALEATGLIEQKSSIFDEPIPNDPTPGLQPTPWRSSNVATKVKQNTKKFFTKGMQKIKDFGNITKTKCSGQSARVFQKLN